MASSVDEELEKSLGEVVEISIAGELEDDDEEAEVLSAEAGAEDVKDDRRESMVRRTLDNLGSI
jgi:hypothetical protein